jgi:hypothetical protein
MIFEIMNSELSLIKSLAKTKSWLKGFEGLYCERFRGFYRIEVGCKTCAEFPFNRMWCQVNGESVFSKHCVI